MLKYLLILPFYILFSCNRDKPVQTDETLVPDSGTETIADLIQTRDTSIYGSKYTIFGEDSIYKHSWYGSIQVLYRHPEPVGKIHYKIYDENKIVKTIAYTRDTMFVNPVEFDMDSIFPYSDEIISFHENGKIKRKSYLAYPDEKAFLFGLDHWETYEDFDEDGILTDRNTPCPPGGMSHIHETFHPNGQRKEFYEQGFIYGSGGLEEYTKWDSQGRLEETHTFDYTFPEDGESYNSRQCTLTIRQYHPNGKLKHIRHLISTVESHQCPCGEWVTYNDQGEEIHRQSYGPCKEFFMDCEEDPELW